MNNNPPPSNNELNSIFQEFWAVLMNPPDFLETDFLGSIKELDPKFNFLPRGASACDPGRIVSGAPPARPEIFTF